MREERYPIQIAVTPTGSVLSLCSDGTIWVWTSWEDRPLWQRFPGPPKDMLVTGLQEKGGDR